MNRYRGLQTALLVMAISMDAIFASACSMYKLTAGGKTMVGNNEDSWRLTSQIWFEQGSADRFGVAYVGYADKPNPDGAFNDQGLAFDAFTMYAKPGLPARDATKKDFSYNDLKTIMQQCSTVDQVYRFLAGRNLQLLNGSPLFNGGMLLFVDRTGKYLVVESDKLTPGSDNKFLLANFSITDTKDLSKVKMERYRKGMAFVRNSIDTSFRFCTALSQTMSVTRDKAGDGTLYTTIYDLKALSIRAYFFHDYDTGITFDLKGELAKGNHAYRFADLFPGNKGYQRFISYKTPQNSRAILLFLIGSAALFLFSFCYFLISFIKATRRRATVAGSYLLTRLAIALLSLLLCYYSYALITNQAIFYFPAPYHEDRFAWINIGSYLPFLLLVILLPLLVLNIRTLRESTWNGFAKKLFALHTLTVLAMLGLFAYWGLFDIIHQRH